MSDLHAVQDGTPASCTSAISQVSVATGSRTCPPKACTSADDVEGMLELVEDLRAINDVRKMVLVEIAAAADLPGVKAGLRKLKLLDDTGNDDLYALAGRIEGVLGRLRHAEAIHNWDDLAGQEPTGTAIAVAIRDCLDAIRDPAASAVAIADARGDLATWFDRYDVDVLFGKTIADRLRKNRLARLTDERERWLQARTKAGETA